MLEALFDEFRFLATYLKMTVGAIQQRIAGCLYLAQV